MLKQMGLEYEFPVILGRDYAGVVEQVGPEVTRYGVGDEVFGFLLRQSGRPRGKLGELIAVPRTCSSAGLLRVSPRHRRRGAARRHRRDHGDRRARAVRRRHGADRRCDRGVGSLLAAPPAPPSSPRRCPRTRPTCASSASASCCPRRRPRRGRRERHPDASTRCSTWNYAPGVPATLAKEGGRVASPTGAAGEGPGRTMIWPPPKTSNASRACSPTARCAYPSRRRTSSRRRPTPSPRCPQRTRGARSRSAFRNGAAMNLQLGVYSFGDTPPDDGGYGATAQAIRNVLEAVHLADEVGLDSSASASTTPARCRCRRRPRSSMPPDDTVSRWTESPRVRYSSLPTSKRSSSVGRREHPPRPDCV